ncbi:hypothetical protein HKI87_13g75430 [Chloropicon roscoffensis]|uniref:Uncharacterized protein n=1 Tax=Chloropicon roscoffensis TaxID=1461544 RepID=A0AAX4PI26_9CHLO
MLAKAKGAVAGRAAAIANQAESIATLNVESQIKSGAAAVQNAVEANLRGARGGGGIGGTVAAVGVGVGVAAVTAAASTIAPAVVSMVKQSEEEVPVPPATCWCGFTPMSPGCLATTTKALCFLPSLVFHLLGWLCYAAVAQVDLAVMACLCLFPATRVRVSKTTGKTLSWLRNAKHGKPWVTDHILTQARRDPETGCLEGCHYCMAQCQLRNGEPTEVCTLCCETYCGGGRFKSGHYYGHGVAAPCQVCLLDNDEQV